ncbi:conserved hypothetical protein [Ancylobacter novellus DSM 506]|uniref:Uncharacterized protein n=1 Tax=Ancylobacter novellus (strain ATCC 8093 / DSM 506 / JCM 20403 / CCM 1077 / IAM 12100 / NBRC 12443 / NCIMB 10456) TaxID=639283 RepID=D7A2U9_ANCN5|nr:hypothetical protein [Ancylobacter novellus]ADH91629.1 conserved hypothetical protein [Ancylobacter novellus DSM 506]
MYLVARQAFALLAVSTLATAAYTAETGLTLQQGDIFTNDVGTVMAVSVVNGTANTVGSVAVNCAFTAGGKAVGSAGTTIYNVVAGEKGQDQVHLMGAKADAASCTITSTTAPAN